MKRREFITVMVGSISLWPGLAQGQSANAVTAYDKALDDFRSILAQRRALVESKRPPPTLPGQDLYLARNKMFAAYKDLTDVVPGRIGRPNKFRIPPAYF